MKTKHTGYATTTAALTAVLAAGAMSASTTPASASAQSVVIKAVLPPATGGITAKDNAGLLSLTKAYEKAHTGVTVQWLPNSSGNITTSNAQVETEAAGGDAPDLVWEQYGAVTSGELPAGLLQNIKPYLEKPNPYVKGNKSWLSLFSKGTLPYMTSTNGNIYIVLGSNVETGMFYSKAAFAKAGIKAAPTTWAALMTDLAKLKGAGITPFMFADGGGCDPSWYERLATSSFLAGQVNRFMVDRAQVATPLDLAVGIQKGIIGMANPRYAAVWKLLGNMSPYFSSAGSSYDACSNPSAVSPPLSPESLLIQGKVGIEWGGSWWIPQLASAGFSGKYGVFPEPVITKATSPYATGTVTTGLIGGPNGNGQWSVTSQRADRTMTPAKTKVVMDFLAWLFTPQHLGHWLEINQGGGDIPTEPAAPTATVPGLQGLLPSGKVPAVVLPVTGGLLTSASSTQGLRLIQEFIAGTLSYSSFASQWQSVLTTAAQTWATANHVNLQKYK